MMSFSVFDDMFKSPSLVCKLHTSHVTQSMLLQVVIAQGANFKLIPFLEVEILMGRVPPHSTSQIIPCILTILAKRCVLKCSNVQSVRTCWEVLCPVMLSSYPAALLKVVFHTTLYLFSSARSFETLTWIFQEYN